MHNHIGGSTLYSPDTAAVFLIMLCNGSRLRSGAQNFAAPKRPTRHTITACLEPAAESMSCASEKAFDLAQGVPYSSARWCHACRLTCRQLLSRKRQSMHIYMHAPHASRHVAADIYNHIPSPDRG